MRDIALINPPRYEGTPVIRHFRSNYLYNYVIPPMDLAYFSQVAKDHGGKVELIDANGEDLDHLETVERLSGFGPDLIVVNAAFNIVEHELEAVRRYSENHDVDIVLSSRTSIGSEPELFEKFGFLDGVARGEIDAFAPELADGKPLNQVEGMAARKDLNEPIRVVEDLDEHPIPDIDALPDLWYDEYSVPNYFAEGGYFLTGARGCPYGCTFCPVGGHEGQPFYYRERSIENVMEEIRMIDERGIDDFFFFNEIFTFPGFANDLCDAIVESGLDVSWVCEGKSNHVQDEMLGKMKDAGCKAVYYGVESGSDRIIQDVKKGQDSEDVKKAFRLTKENDMMAGAYIILGFPGDSWKTFYQTVKLMREIEPDTIKMAILAPYKGTEIYREMRERNLVNTEGGESYDRNLTSYRDTSTRTCHLTNTELKLMDNLFRLIFRDKVF